MYRYNKNVPHESFRKLQLILGTEPKNLKEGFFTQPTPAMPDDVKNESSVVAYRDYYIKYKQHLAKWTKREVPHWMEIYAA